MDWPALVVFSTAYLMAVASPGPGVAALMARVLAHGTGGVTPFIAGYVCGDLVWFTVAATGLAVLAQTFAGLFLVVKYAGAAYLLWLAYRLWTAPPSRPTPRRDRPIAARRCFLAGLLVTLGNPKVIVFFLALLPAVIDLEALTLGGFVEIGLLIVVILSGVLAGYAMAAARARRLFASPGARRVLNRSTGAVMAGAAAAIAAR
jgi:threonine/homoserine/homoserine lactone efflux protein